MSMNYKRTLALTADGDLRLENGQLVWIDGPAGVEQELKTTIATVAGEDPFDPEHGFDVFEATGSPAEIVEREVRTALQEDDRVESVASIEIDGPGPDRRTYVSVEVTLVDGSSVDVATEVSV